MSRRKSRRLKYFVVTILVAVLLVGVFFGFQYIKKIGIFRVPGVVYYDESLSPEEKTKLEAIFTEDVELDKDVTISASISNTKPELAEDELLTAVSVPVADFYDVRNDIAEYEEGEYSYIPISELDFTKKLLTIDKNYYLDSFDSGAIFRTIKFDSENYENEIKPLVEEQFSVGDLPSRDSVLTFAQTGVTALSRGMNQKLVAVGGDATYFAEYIKDFLSGFDLTHTSNESSFTNLATSENICSDTRFIDTLTTIGLDIVELTGNHNVDCGAEAAINSVDIYEQNNIRHVGGGKNAEDAAIPLQINEKNNGVTFLAYNLSTGGATTGAAPGANQYYEANAVEEINSARERGDFVVVDIQYYECSAYASEYEDPACDRANSSAGDQIGFFRHLIDLGANMVVGTSAHQPQTYELYGDGVIYYGLGNLFFDQYWWPGTTRSLVLGNYYYKNKLLQTKITPTVYDSSMQTKVLDEETAKWFLRRLVNVKP